jgi:hypothetical protein
MTDGKNGIDEILPGVGGQQESISLSGELIEPELRLISFLPDWKRSHLKNEIITENVENAYLTYLEKLDKCSVP